MTVFLTWDTVITAGAIVSAMALIVAAFAKLVRWVDKQKEQDQRINALAKHHESDMAESRSERQLIVYGLLACLKGLQEQGCNGTVTDAIKKFEKHLNAQAHKGGNANVI